jgi:hypothetical protein
MVSPGFVRLNPYSAATSVVLLTGVVGTEAIPAGANQFDIATNKGIREYVYQDFRASQYLVVKSSIPDCASASLHHSPLQNTLSALPDILTFVRGDHPYHSRTLASCTSWLCLSPAFAGLDFGP